MLLAALLAGLEWVLWRRAAPPEHPLKSGEERSEEDGEGKECNLYIALTCSDSSLLRTANPPVSSEDSRRNKTPIVTSIRNTRNCINMTLTLTNAKLLTEKVKLIYNIL